MEAPKKIHIRNAAAFDPAQDWKGECRDIYMAEGHISPPIDNPDIIIEAGGRITMAGGIDPNCSIALPGQVFARLSGGLPSPLEIGKTYARMGYVHVHQPFTTLLMAGETRRWLNRIPFIDKSFRVALDFRDMGKNIKNGKQADFCSEAKAIIHLTGALGLFLTFPFLKHKQTYYFQKNVSTKKTFEFLEGLDDPDMFPIVIWGMHGLFDKEIPMAEGLVISGLDRALDSDTAMENVQKFLESGGRADMGLNHGGEYLSVDCADGFRPGTINMDAGIQNSYPLSYELQSDLPDDTNSINGWSLLNRMAATGKLSLSSLSPPSGKTDRIPMTSSWMLCREGRPQAVENVMGGTVFSFGDIARLTRLESARQLGFEDLGHLKAGADANVSIYDIKPEMDTADLTEALSNCWCLIKGGQSVIENGCFTDTPPPSEIRYRNIDADPELFKHTALLQNPTLRLANLAMIRKTEE